MKFLEEDFIESVISKFGDDIKKLNLSNNGTFLSIQTYSKFVNMSYCRVAEYTKDRKIWNQFINFEFIKKFFD